MKKLGLCVLLALVMGGCYGDDSNLTEAGEGKPELELEFPTETTVGVTETATLTITNPGPGDMDSLVVAFSRLGDPKLPQPIVDVVAGDDDGPVSDVSPQPNAVSPDGVIYTFDGLPEGESMSITFTVVMPSSTGPAGNSIQVYEGQDPERARGVRLETEVAG